MSHGKWVGTAVWAFSIAALAVVTVQISTLAASPSASMGLYTLRHLLLGQLSSPWCGCCRQSRGIGSDADGHPRRHSRPARSPVVLH